MTGFLKLISPPLYSMRNAGFFDKSAMATTSHAATPLNMVYDGPPVPFDVFFLLFNKNFQAPFCSSVYSCQIVFSHIVGDGGARY